MSRRALKGRVRSSFPKLIVAGSAVLLAGAAWLACTPPGGGDPIPPDGADGPLALSASKVAAGQFFAIEHPSIQAGDLVQVRFRQLDGVEMTFESQEAEAGLVRVPAPPVIDEVTGLRGGILRISIEGVEEELSLEVEALPVLPDVPPGTILDMLLNSAIEDLFDLETTLRDAPEEFGEVSQTEATLFAVTQERRRLENMHIQLVLNESLRVSVSEDEEVTLTETELRELDAYLVAMLAGLRDELQLSNGNSTARVLQENCFAQIREGSLKGADEIVDCVFGIVEDVKRDALVGAKKAGIFVGTIISLAFTAGGAAVQEGRLFLTGVLTTAGNSIWSFGTAYFSKENTDAFLLRQGERFNASKEALSQVFRNVTNFLGGVPGRLGLFFTAVTAATSVKDLSAVAETARCEGGQPNQRVIQSADDLAFCSIVTANGDGDQPDDGPPDGTCGECPAEFPLCNEELGLCVACLDDQDCTDGTVCATNLGGCVECVEDADCVAAGRGTNCRIFVCDDDGPECSTDFDCMAAGLGNACTSDGTTDVCVTVPGNCFSDGDCSAGLFCVLASGEDAGTCAECRNDEDCDEGLTCDGFFRCTCVPGFCPVP